MGMDGDTDRSQCEKHAKKEEALAKLQAGSKFNDVAMEFSEDKARQGMFHPQFPAECSSGYLAGCLLLSLPLRTQGAGF